MTRGSPRWLGYLILFATAACGGGTGPSGTPPPPPPPPPPAPVASVGVTPGQASVEAGSTVQLSAQPRDAAGNALSGRSVSWSSDNQPVATVDNNGLVTGVSPGRATISAISEGRSGTASIEVTAPPPVVINQIAPATLVEGQPATVTGSGFSATPNLNEVTVAGIAAIVSQASATSLTFAVPAACLPKGSNAAIEIKVGSRTSNQVAQPIAPASLQALAVGQQVVLTAPARRCLQLDQSATAERYLIGVQSSGPGSDLSDLTIEADVPPGSAPAPMLASVPDSPIRQGRIDPEELARIQRWQRHLAATAAYYEATRPLLQQLADRERTLTFAPASAPSVPGSVKEGDVVPIRVGVFNSGSCSQFETIQGLVRKIADKAIMIEDQANPVSLDQPSLDAAATSFTQIYDIDVDFFGQPGDLDGNGRVVIVITKEVNRIANGPIGFVGGGNHASTAMCPASNEGEYFFMRSPDPNGVHAAGVYTVAQLTRDFTNLLIHEFAHIIQIARRRAVGGQFMSSFVAEGLATGAQEVAGFQLLGLQPGGNYGASTVYTTWGADPRSFFGYHNDLLSYYGFNFANGRVAGAPEQCTWAGSTVPGGQQGPCNRAVRLLYGVTWSLIKHAIDRHFGGAAGQKAVLRAFSEHAGATGYAELEAVLGQPIATLMAEWAPMLYLDGRFPTLTAFQNPSWNLRDIAAVWQTPNADLVTRSRAFADFSEDVMVRGGSFALYELSGANRPATTVRARSRGSRETPAAVSIWAVRVQ